MSKIIGLMVIGAIASLAALAPASAQQHRLCELKKTYCATKTRTITGDLYIGDPRQRAMCKQVKDLIDLNNVPCGKKKGRLSAAKRCELAKEARMDPNANDWMAFSYDRSNAAINGYCRRASAWNARQCAYQQCVAKGGRSCQVPCNPANGNALRVCRERFITIVAGPEWARMGCGERYLASYGGTGEYTRETYVEREMARCLKRHRGNAVCTVQNIFQ